MTFQQLQYLLEIYRSNSIRKAAENLFVTPSSTSACLSNLEEELGFPIFIRNQRGLTPTAQGQTVLDYAQRICDIYHQMNNLQNKTFRTVQISCVHHPAARAAFVRLVGKHAKRKDLAFSWTNCSLDNAIRKLLSTELDIGLFAHHSRNIRALESRLEDAHLTWRVLKELPFCVCVGPSHPLYHKTSVIPRELEDELLIDSAEKIYSSDLMKAYMKFTPDRVLATDDLLLQQELVETGVGYAIKTLPPSVDIQKSSLRYIPIEGVSATLLAVTNPKPPSFDVLDEYIQLLEEELAKD